MSDFNYQEYLRNNPLLKKEVKEEKLLTESQEVEELAVDRTGKDKPSGGSFRKGQYGIGDAVLDLFKKLKKENLSEDKYDDLVAGDKDIPADKKADAAKALRMLDKGASYEKVKHLLEDKEIQEGIPQGSEIADYVEGMFNSSVVEKEGFQSDIWRKEQYASNDYREGSVFLDLVNHLKSVGGKDVLEGNPDIHLELLSNDDIKWSADVTLDENLATEEVTEGNLDDLRKLMDDLINALAAFKKKANELKLAVDSGNVTQTVNNYIEDVFKADYERTGGKIDENEEVTEEEVPSSKMTVSELKAKIKEDILSILSEQDEEEDVEVDVEDEVDVDIDTEEPAVDAVGGGDEGLTADEKEIQDSLKIAYDNAVAIGDTKLADQIGNSITFFTRTHVVER